MLFGGHAGSSCKTQGWHNSLYPVFMFTCTIFGCNTSVCVCTQRTAILSLGILQNSSSELDVEEEGSFSLTQGMGAAIAL